MKKYIFMVLKEKCYTTETYVMAECGYYAGMASRAKISKLELFTRDRATDCEYFKNLYSTEFMFTTNYATLKQRSHITQII